MSHDDKPKGRQFGLKRLFGTVLLFALCAATFRLLGLLGLLFMLMYLVAYIDFLERPNPLTLWAAAAVTVVLSILSGIYTISN